MRENNSNIRSRKESASQRARIKFARLLTPNKKEANNHQRICVYKYRRIDGSFSFAQLSSSSVWIAQHWLFLGTRNGARKRLKISCPTGQSFISNQEEFFYIKLRARLLREAPTSSESFFFPAICIAQKRNFFQSTTLFGRISPGFVRHKLGRRRRSTSCRVSIRKSLFAASGLATLRRNT